VNEVAPSCSVGTSILVTYSWGEHVGELELRLEASAEEAVFAAAAAALGDALGADGDGVEEWFDVSAEGADRAALLAAWLEELIFLAEDQGLVPLEARDVRLEPARVRGRVGGRRGEPPHLVKAVTYHRLAFERRGDGWTATVVLDV
jgi:SHS2 domain-containing protein